jgi:glycosyltransferase involved in cell wall biosynthesis
MGALLQFVLLFICWLAALATLLVFLETWVGLSNGSRFIARRASGAYGVITVFVPMCGAREKIDRVIRSVYGQSYPFIELILIHCEEDRQLGRLAKDFSLLRSHIPVRIVTTLFPISSHANRIRALEHAQPTARGRWFIILDPDVQLDRFAIEAAVEFAGCNDVSALALHPGIRCRSSVEKVIAPSMEQLFQIVRIASRRREKQNKAEFDASFLIIHREAFEIVNRINRIPGILNESGWSLWAYQVEGFRTFQADGARWLWRDASIRTWFSETDVYTRYGHVSAPLIVLSAVLSMIPLFGIGFGLIHGVGDFNGASILAFAGVSYLLMWISYFLFARRLYAAVWFAPFWVLSQLPAAGLAIWEMRRLSRERMKDVAAKTPVL